MSAIRTWQLLLWKDTRRLCISWKSENRLNVQTVESFFKARRGLFSTCVSTHWTPKRMISFPAQNLQSASTKRIQGPIWVTTEGEFTKHQQDQANGCALLVRVKKSPDLFSTTTSIKNTNKIMPMWIVLNAISAKRNLRRHVNRKHKAVEVNISRNSNESNPDDNFNPETIDIHSVPFQMCS